MVSTCLTLGIGFSDQAMLARMFSITPLTYFSYSKYEKFISEYILELQQEVLEENRWLKTSLSPTKDSMAQITASFDMG